MVDNHPVDSIWLAGIISALTEYKFAFTVVSTNHPLWGRMQFVDVPVLQIMFSVPTFASMGVLEIVHNHSLSDHIFEPSATPTDFAKGFIRNHLDYLYTH
jgi:hypothetical protein